MVIIIILRLWSQGEKQQNILRAMKFDQALSINSEERSITSR